MNQNKDLDIDVIVYGEPLPKEKNAYGQDIVIIPVRKDTTNVLPYSIRVSVKAPKDPKFPCFRTKLTIDGHTETFDYAYRAGRVLELSSMEYEMLGFGPIRSRSSTSASSPDPTVAGGMGTITVKVTSCKITKTTKWKEPNILPRRFDIGGKSVEKKMDELELQSTKWKTVSAGLRKLGQVSYDVEEGPLCQTITLLYMDWETMEQNRSLADPELIPREDYEIMKTEIIKQKSKKFKSKESKFMKFVKGLMRPKPKKS